MLPPDLDLPCVTNREPFDAVIDLYDDYWHPERQRHPGKRKRAVLQAARDICGTCPFQIQCLHEFGDAVGVIGGLTLDERATLKLGRVS